MRTRALSLFALLFIASVAAGAEIRGAWNAIVKGDHVHLNLVRAYNNWGRSFPRSEFALSENEVNSATETPVHFTFNRDAGTIDFTGTFQSGEGVGRFRFTPNRGYADTLRSLHVPSEEQFDDEQLFALAMHDVSAAFIREMQSLGYREDLDQYIAFRIHGVSPQFVRDLKALGYTLDADQLLAFRIHGVTPQYIREMRDFGIKDLAADQLVAMRIHGVTPEFVRELRELGYSGLTSDELVSMRIHGVSTRFIRELGEAGYHGIPVEKLVEMRIHGIDASMLRQK